jgi:hypothetical protein
MMYHGKSDSLYRHCCPAVDSVSDDSHRWAHIVQLGWRFRRNIIKIVNSMVSCLPVARLHSFGADLRQLGKLGSKLVVVATHPTNPGVWFIFIRPVLSHGQYLATTTNVTVQTPRIAVNQAVGRYVPRDDRARTNHGKLADGNARHYH